MSCDVGEATESLENELCFTYVTAHYPTLPSLYYVAAHSPTLPLFHLRHSSFSNPSFASPMSQDFHLRHLASRPWVRICVCYTMEYWLQAYSLLPIITESVLVLLYLKYGMSSSSPFCSGQIARPETLWPRVRSLHVESVVDQSESRAGFLFVLPLTTDTSWCVWSGQRHRCVSQILIKGLGFISFHSPQS